MVHQQSEHLNSHGFKETFGPATLKDDGSYTGGAALIGNAVDYWSSNIDGLFFPDTLHNWTKGFVEKGISN